MAVRRGTATPSAVFRGTVPVKKIMRGTVEVWSASPYPVSGEWGPTALTGASVMATHIIANDGNYTGTHTMLGGNALTACLIRVNGTALSSDDGNPAIATVTGNLAAGDVVEFTTLVSATRTLSGTWSIVKN